MNKLRTHGKHSLSRNTYAVLVALSAGEQTASEISSQVIGDTFGVYILASSLYNILHRLEGEELVAARAGSYKLTDRGWHKLEHHTRTLELLVGHAKRRIIASGHGRW